MDKKDEQVSRVCRYCLNWASSTSWCIVFSRKVGMYNSCDSDFMIVTGELLADRRCLCDEQSAKADDKESEEEPFPR